MDNLNYIKERFEGCFDVKYRDVKTIIGDGTLVFIDDLCNGQWMMEYLILNLKIKKLKKFYLLKIIVWQFIYY